MGKLLESIARISCAIALIIPSAQGVAKDADTLIFDPTSPWNVDYSNDSCSLRRTYGSGDLTLVSQFEMRGPSDFLKVLLASREIKTHKGKVSYRFDPDDTLHVPPNATVQASSDGVQGVRFTAILGRALPKQSLGLEASARQSRDRQELEAKISGLTLVGGFEKDIFVRTGPMNDAMDALRTCRDDLFVSWGFDPSLDDAVAAPASRIDSVGLARRVMQAYPKELGRLGVSASVNVLVSIDKAGQLMKCYAHNQGPNPEFEKAACDTLMRYARYEPARDADDNPTESFDALELHFSPN